jgi:hypothetical protein
VIAMFRQTVDAKNKREEVGQLHLVRGGGLAPCDSVGRLTSVVVVVVDLRCSSRAPANAPVPTTRRLPAGPTRTRSAAL